MHSIGAVQMRRLRLALRQRPPASSATMVAAGTGRAAPRDPPSMFRHGRGRPFAPSHRDCLAPRQSALRPAVARSPAKPRKVRGGRLPSCSVRPHRFKQRHVAHGAFSGASPRLPVRWIAAAALPTRDSAVGAGFPVDAGLLRRARLSRTSGFPRPCRVAAAMSLRSDNGMRRTLRPSSPLHQLNSLSSPRRGRCGGTFRSTSLPESRRRRRCR